MKSLHPNHSEPPKRHTQKSHAIIVLGLSPPVLTLTLWLLAERYNLQQVHLFSTVQGLRRLRTAVNRVGLPACNKLFWHGDDVDGTDGLFSQQHFHHLMTTAFTSCTAEDTWPIQIVLGGGVNWMVSIASQMAHHHQRAASENGLWVLKTDPRFEHHPHFLRPEDTASVLDTNDAYVSSTFSSASLQPVFLVPRHPVEQIPHTHLVFEVLPRGIRYLDRHVLLTPLQTTLYDWLLDLTKRHCKAPQLSACEQCVLCAISAKELAARCHEFYERYRKRGGRLVRGHPMGPADFYERIPEYVSKINATLKKQCNAAIYALLTIQHTVHGYLPVVDKTHLNRDKKEGFDFG